MVPCLTYFGFLLSMDDGGFGNLQRDRRDWEGRLAVGSSFEVEWQRRYDLVMRSCDHLVNPWNENKPVRIARDGQEMPASIGKQLVDAIEQAAVADHVVKPRMSPSLPQSMLQACLCLSIARVPSVNQHGLIA